MNDSITPQVDFSLTVNEKNCTVALSVRAVAFYRECYQYEEIKGAERKTVEMISEAAFREAVANALIHRAWDIDARIRILMFEDCIQVISPGNLPSGMTEDEYLAEKISVLRNPVLANVFYRLRIVEIFGMGVLRIKECYKNCVIKPEFQISDNSISVLLPLSRMDLPLSADERMVYETLSRNIPKAISEITASVQFGKFKVSEILHLLASSELWATAAEQSTACSR